MFDYDHTTKKVPKKDRESRSRSRERDKIRTPESGRGKDIRTKGGGLKKVPNKSSAGKAGAGSKGKRPSIQVVPKIRLSTLCFFSNECFMSFDS